MQTEDLMPTQLRDMELVWNDPTDPVNPTVYDNGIADLRQLRRDNPFQFLDRLRALQRDYDQAKDRKRDRELEEAKHERAIQKELDDRKEAAEKRASAERLAALKEAEAQALANAKEAEAKTREAEARIKEAEALLAPTIAPIEWDGKGPCPTCGEEKVAEETADRKEWFRNMLEKRNVQH